MISALNYLFNEILHHHAQIELPIHEHNWEYGNYRLEKNGNTLVLTIYNLRKKEQILEWMDEFIAKNKSKFVRSQTRDRSREWGTESTVSVLYNHNLFALKNVLIIVNLWSFYK